MNTNSVRKLKEHPNFEDLHMLRDGSGKVIAISMKYFAATYKDKIHCSYNDMFNVLRCENVIEKIDLNGRKTNIPTEEYKGFFVQREINRDDGTTIKLFVKKDGAELILKVLKERKILYWKLKKGWYRYGEIKII